MRITILLLIVLFTAGLDARSRDPLPVPDLPGYHTLKCDFHMHTVFSDGSVWPAIRVDEAWRDGLDAIAITDHAGYNPHKDDIRGDLTRPNAISRPLAEGLGIILIPGVEIMQGNLHCNALFVTDPNAFEGLELEAALQKARAQDAFVFWNHPGWKETPQWFPPIASVYEKKLLQGMEIINGLTFYPEAYPWIAEKKLTIMANSDVHAPIAMDYRPRTRPITLVFAPSRDAAGVREALFARRTAAWMGGEIWGAEEYVRGLWERSAEPMSTEFQFTREVRRVALQIRNRSAIPFRMDVKKTAPWLAVSSEEIPADGIAVVSLYAQKDAPMGSHRVDVQLEITNLHVAPGRNLSVQLPLSINVKE